MAKIHTIILISVVIIIAVFFVTYSEINIGKTKKTAVPVITSAPVVAKTVPDFTDFHLLIPSLNISVPIIADVDGSDKDAYFKALEKGVAHYKNTAKPGENGNIFIFGHSSFYAWKPGEYKDIFKNLDDLNIGDEIVIWWQSKKYNYKVSKKDMVDPDDTRYVQPTDSEQLTVMTCWPPGTTSKRLIIVGEPSN
jgi:sortase A